MRLAVCRMLVIALMVTQTAIGQTPPHPASRIELVRAAGVSEAQARAVIAAHRDAIEQCVQTARELDPVGADAVPWVTARLRLQGDGSVGMLELDPSNLARGLSACLAGDLLAWHLDGVTARAAAVRIQIRVGP